MRIFILSTGRCGSTTFSEACKHITNYTVGHESHRKIPNYNNLDYNDNHIEVDPRLWFFMSLLLAKYPNARFGHLWRDKQEVLESWWYIHKNTEKWKFGQTAPLLSHVFQVEPMIYKQRGAFMASGKLMYDTEVSQIRFFLKNSPANALPDEYQTGNITRDQWRRFWRQIKAAGDFDASYAALSQVHNTSGRGNS